MEGAGEHGILSGFGQDDIVSSVGFAEASSIRSWGGACDLVDDHPRGCCATATWKRTVPWFLPRRLPGGLKARSLTEPANAGMGLQALMALLGHVTPQMTIRYATLASPTLRAACDEAMGKMRRQFTLTPARQGRLAA
jgi:hypothetical protein